MASISAIRDGLKTRLETISGLRAHDTVPGQINPPAAVVRRRQINFDSTMARGSDDFLFTITLLIQFGENRNAQNQLDAYLAGSGTLSIKAAIEGEQTLGGVVDFARVAQAGEDALMEYNGVEYLSVDFTVEVTADGSV